MLRGRTPIYANCRSLNRAASESCKQCDSRLPPLGPAAGINGRIVGHLGALRSQHIPAPSIKGFRSTGYHNLACRMATKLARARQGPESQVQNLQACGSCKLNPRCDIPLRTKRACCQQDACLQRPRFWHSGFWLRVLGGTGTGFWLKTLSKPSRVLIN